mmetsp:Transcript_1483/g.1963  ORF Transcript_1483/g.1963 Transcript_1483/m.1963 type:complete len:372 (+) Transcript_1483:61-1176(+)
MANLEEALRSKKLKPASLRTENSKPAPAKVVGFDDEDPNAIFTEDEVRKMKEAHFSTNMDRLVSQIGEEYTFPTVFFPLTVDQAKAMLVNSSAPNKIKKAHEGSTPYENDFQQLITKLDQFIDSVQGHSNGCFVKLSCRSAKDVSVSSPKTFQIYQQEIAGRTQNKTLTPEELHNERVCALYKASLHSMKVYSAKEALDLLLQSKRIAFDLELDVRFPSEFSTHVIVRPWREIPLMSEFRGFVTNKNLNALSQYYTHCYFAELQTNKQECQQVICDFFNRNIKDKIPLESYVIDFVVELDSSGKPSKCSVLELNPFNPSTGACLFSWEDEKDEKVMREGPFEFRIWNQMPPKQRVKPGLTPEWQAIVYADE